MLLLLLFQATISEVNACGMTVELERFHQCIQFHFVAVWQKAAEGQPAAMASDMEVCVNQGGGIEFLHAEKWLQVLTFM